MLAIDRCRVTPGRPAVTFPTLSAKDFHVSCLLFPVAHALYAFSVSQMYVEFEQEKPNPINARNNATPEGKKNYRLNDVFDALETQKAAEGAMRRGDAAQGGRLFCRLWFSRL